jgi:hypothetical protein
MLVPCPVKLAMDILFSLGFLAVYYPNPTCWPPAEPSTAGSITKPNPVTFIDKPTVSHIPIKRRFLSFVVRFNFWDIPMLSIQMYYASYFFALFHLWWPIEFINRNTRWQHDVALPEGIWEETCCAVWVYFFLFIFLQLKLGLDALICIYLIWL